MATTLEVLSGAVEAKLGDSSVKHLVGAIHLHSNEGSPPRVIWVSPGGTVEPTSFIGRKKFDKDGLKYALRYRYDDLLTVQAHIWTASYEEFERLRNRLLSVTRACFGTASQPGAYALDTEAERMGRVHAGQAAGVQTFTWRACVAEWTGVERDELGALVPFRKLVVTDGENVIGTIDPNLTT